MRAPERRGKEAAQQLAVEPASGEILIFSDVATALAPDGVSTIVANFADPTVGCVSSVDRFVDADGRVSGEGAYVRYEMWLRALETPRQQPRRPERIVLRGAARGLPPLGRRSPERLQHAAERGRARPARRARTSESAGYYRNIADDRREFDRKVRTVVRGIAVLADQPAHAEPVSVRPVRVAAGQPQAVPLAGAVRDDRGAVVSNAALVRSRRSMVTTFLHAARLLRRGPRRPRGPGPAALRIPTFLVVANLARPDRLVALRPRRADRELESVRAPQRAATTAESPAEPVSDRASHLLAPRTPHMITNALSVDVEEYYHAAIFRNGTRTAGRGPLREPGRAERGPAARRCCSEHSQQGHVLRPG